ncbi:MAG: DUF4412 domain-containing protein [Bacteroidota bacterium]
MKYRTLIFSLFLIATTSLVAQDFFEGSIHFKVQMSGAEAEMLALNKPNNEMNMHLRGGSYIVQLYGGEYPKQFMFVADSNFEYSIDMSNQRAYRFSPHSDINRNTHKNEKKKEYIAQPTGKTETINGVECEEFKLVKEGVVFFYYVNDQIRVDLAAFPQPCRAKASFLVDGLDGRIPLKTIRKTKAITVITTADKVTSREFDDSQFLIPADFEVKMRDYRY